MRNKKGQDQKSKILSANSKRGQEEIAGFAVILVLVAIILLVFLTFYLKKPSSEDIKSYEVNSFIQSFLQVTTPCEQNYGNLSVQDLIFECRKGADCLYGKKSCEVLNSTLKSILDESWKVGEGLPIRGYQLNITANEQSLINLSKGITTQDYKGSSQSFSKEFYKIDIIFYAYY